jgi:putative membrane protein
MVWHMDDGMGWWMVIGSFWFLLFGVAIFWAVARATERPQQGERGESALEILRKRYARGEITKEQFDQMRRDVSD